jgi:hypothetical protein
LKWLSRYLNGTLGFGLRFKRFSQDENVVYDYVDANFAIVLIEGNP